MREGEGRGGEERGGEEERGGGRDKGRERDRGKEEGEGIQFIFALQMCAIIISMVKTFFFFFFNFSDILKGLGPYCKSKL